MFNILSMALSTILRTLFHPAFWIVLVIVYIQYKRIDKIRIEILGTEEKRFFGMFFRSIVTGVMGGIIGTIFIMLIGISVKVYDFYYILPLAILLMLINVRYICFSYAGGILCMMNLVLGIPKLHVESILAIIAILHLVESILIYVDGYQYAIPMLLEHKKYGVIGAYSMQKFWPIPFVVLMMMSDANHTVAIDVLNVWPLFKEESMNMILQLSVVVAALGYSDKTLTDIPKQKCRQSAKRLFVYSIILLILSILSIKIQSIKYIAALFAPLAHEGLIIYSQKEENRKIPLYKRHKGITILYVKRESIGQKMGLNPSDVILQMNDVVLKDKGDLEYILKTNPTSMKCMVMDVNGKIKTKSYFHNRGIKQLGVLMVPKDSHVIFYTKDSMCLLKNIIQWVKSMKKPCK